MLPHWVKPGGKSLLMKGEIRRGSSGGKAFPAEVKQLQPLKFGFHGERGKQLWERMATEKEVIAGKKGGNSLGELIADEAVEDSMSPKVRRGNCMM